MIWQQNGGENYSDPDGGEESTWILTTDKLIRLSLLGYLELPGVEDDLGSESGSRVKGRPGGSRRTLLGTQSVSAEVTCEESSPTEGT